MWLKACGSRMIFQPGWTGHRKRALLWSVLGSSNNVPSSPSLWSMASLGGLVTASIVHIKQVRCFPGALSHIDHGPLIQAADRHPPCPSRVQVGASSLYPCCRRDRMSRGWLGFSILPCWYSRSSNDLLPQGHHVFPSCHSSGEANRSTDHWGWTLRCSSRVITRGDWMLGTFI